MLETVANILLVVLGISLLIFLHELGHFLAARMFKVRVETFSIGFGPRIAGTRRGDTDYRISAIPLGGYVKMAGEYGDYPDDDERELDPDDLMAKPIWQRFIIFSAGVIANFLFAFIAYPLAYGSGALVHAPVAGDVAVAGPAWAAGIRSGDEFLSVNGQRVYSFEDVVLEMALSDPEGTTARIRRDGVELDVDIVPVRSADGSRYEIAAEPLLENSLIVAKGSPAAAAGLKTGDRIVRAGDDWVVGDIWNGGPLSAKRALTLAAPNGGRLSVQVERDGELIDATVEPAPTERLMLGAGAVRTRVLALRGAADRPDFPLQPDQAIVDDHRLIDHRRSRILEIGADGLIAGHRAPVGHPGLDQQPRRMADRRHRLARIEKGANEAHRRLVAAQLVRIGHPAGEQQGVVGRGIGLRQRLVHREAIAGRQMVETLDLAGLERHHMHGGPGVLQGLHRFDQLHLLHAVGGEGGDDFSGQRPGHCGPFSARGSPPTTAPAGGSCGPACPVRLAGPSSGHDTRADLPAARLRVRRRRISPGAGRAAPCPARRRRSSLSGRPAPP